MGLGVGLATWSVPLMLRSMVRRLTPPLLGLGFGLGFGVGLG